MGWLLDTVIRTQLGPLYALGGLLNTATGGKTGTYDILTALRGGGGQTVYSEAIRAASAYDPGSDIADGEFEHWQIPVFNPHTKEAVDDVINLIPPWLKLAAVGVVAVVLFK